MLLQDEAVDTVGSVIMSERQFSHLCLWVTALFVPSSLWLAGGEQRMLPALIPPRLSRASYSYHLLHPLCHKQRRFVGEIFLTACIGHYLAWFLFNLFRHGDGDVMCGVLVLLVGVFGLPFSFSWPYHLVRHHQDLDNSRLQYQKLDSISNLEPIDRQQQAKQRMRRALPLDRPLTGSSRKLSSW